MIFYLETTSFFWPNSVGVADAATQAGRDSTAMMPRRKTHSTRHELLVTRDSGIAAFQHPKSIIRLNVARQQTFRFLLNL